MDRRSRPRAVSVLVLVLLLERLLPDHRSRVGVEAVEDLLLIQFAARVDAVVHTGERTERRTDLSPPPQCALLVPLRFQTLLVALPVIPRPEEIRRIGRCGSGAEHGWNEKPKQKHRR